MIYVHLVNSRTRYTEMYEWIKYLMRCGYGISYTQVFVRIRDTRKESTEFNVGDEFHFISYDQYKQWCKGKTYAFISEPHTFYHSGYPYCSNAYNSEWLGLKEEKKMPFGKKDSLTTEYVLYHWLSTPKIKKVIFNKPATIVIWEDNSKTVVKCQGDDVYDREKGLALCISKKYLGNKSNFNNEFKKWLSEDSVNV